jgi:hypothetical protein
MSTRPQAKCYSGPVSWGKWFGIVFFLCSISGESWSQPIEESVVLAHIREALPARRPQPYTSLLIRADAEAAKLERREHDACCDIRAVHIGRGLGYLHYNWNEIQGSENYAHDLLRSLIRDMRGTPAGADALFALLSLGSYGGPWFDDDELLPDDLAEKGIHRRIIALLTSPGWSRLKDLRLMKILGEAYETWWCLSLAKADDPYMQQVRARAPDYATGAELARTKALSLYEAILARQADLELRLRLETLRLRQDTHHIVWFRGGD